MARRTSKKLEELIEEEASELEVTSVVPPEVEEAEQAIEQPIALPESLEQQLTSMALKLERLAVDSGLARPAIELARSQVIYAASLAAKSAT